MDIYTGLSLVSPKTAEFCDIA